MSVEPEVALEEFLSAVRAHFQAAAHRSGSTDENVRAAYTALADAFDDYDDAIFTAFDEVTPFELYDDIEDAKEDAEDSDSDDFDDELDDDDYADVEEEDR
ncbi:hypothetical protein NQ036_00805 [Brevibacterium sp. 91QC2O2]|jgi:hypothetical protein|uniref:hypothetical protein n=1 Tax=Brevibacterium TaxID=1696 RepID=UPI00211C7F42|nr:MULTISPECIES: hypothetical protein [unclassified Brevibacterium]MCQ9366788.1 hypothetical protein [Brevibacterium sp. 91QC2O2]MCQ9383938.1 hypothetical protein [Brevibacterium sp. 68QC2CO]